MSRPNTFIRARRGDLSRRAGFSLIEILVVIGLIAFLTAALVAVIPRVANASKVAATKATIKKVNEMLNDRINGFRRWVQKQDQLAGPNNPPSYVTNSPYASSFVTNPVQTRALAVKYAFRLYFPQAFSEFSTPITPSSTHKAVTESSESLYQFLTNGPLFDTEPPSAADLKAIETADTDGDGLPEIVDAWGHPIRFYRWPTRLVRPGGPPTGTVSNFEEVPLSPASILLGAAAPRGNVPTWQAGFPTVGTTIRPNPAHVTQAVPFSLLYRCVAVTGPGQTGATEPVWPTTVGATISDSNSPTSGVTWQALLDPLSVDPDDPLGLVTAGLISEPFETPNTWNTPLIVSSGNDADTLGLFEPYDTANFGNLARPQAPPSGTDPTGYWSDALIKHITNHQL